MKLYLAGPIFMCSDDESSNWRSIIKEKLGKLKDQFGYDNKYHFVDPFDRDLRGLEDSSFRYIVEGDKEMIDECDGLIVGLWKVSAGTCMEILYAWEKGKKVYVINGLDAISPWIKYHSYAIFNNIEDAIDFFKRA